MLFAWMSNKDIAIHYSCSPYNADQKHEEIKYHSNLMKSLINKEKKTWNPPKIKEIFREFSLEKYIFI